MSTPYTPKEIASYTKLVKQSSSKIEALDMLEIASERSRKGLRMALEAGMFGPIPEASIHPVDLAKARLAKDKEKTAHKALVTELGDLRDQVDVYTALSRAKPLPPMTAPSKSGKDAKQRRAIPVLLVSDLHVEETVSKEHAGGYTLAIAESRLQRLAKNFTWFVNDARFDARSALIWIGGDTFSGAIHEELAENNALSTVQAVLWVQEKLETLLRSIANASPQLKTIRVVCNDGNHGRLTKKIRHETRSKNSIEWMMYQNLAMRLGNDPRFEFQIADGAWAFAQVFDYTLAFHHGDSFRGGMGVGGISIPILRGVARMFQNRKIHHVNVGHFHQYTSLANVTINGSLIGPNAYSESLHVAPERPQQAAYWVDAEYGKCMSAPMIVGAE